MEDPNADQILPGEKKEEENIFAGVKNSVCTLIITL